jgi:hypothetical protein
MHRDYEANIHSICLKQANFIASNPSCTLFLTLFDYCAGSPTIEVHSATDSTLAAELLEEGNEYEDMVARAARSGGRMHSHVLRILQGTSIRHWVVPLRTVGSKLNERLREFLPMDAHGKPKKAIMPVINEALNAIH